MCDLTRRQKTSNIQREAVSWENWAPLKFDGSKVVMCVEVPRGRGHLWVGRAWRAELVGGRQVSGLTWVWAQLSIQHLLLFMLSIFCWEIWKSQFCFILVLTSSELELQNNMILVLGFLLKGLKGWSSTEVDQLLHLVSWWRQSGWSEEC